MTSSSSAIAGHKRNYIGYIHPRRAAPPVAAAFDDDAVSAAFEQFLQARLADIPDGKDPADAYPYASHMGAFLRALDQAKDEYIKAVRAYYAIRDSRK